MTPWLKYAHNFNALIYHNQNYIRHKVMAASDVFKRVANFGQQRWCWTLFSNWTNLALNKLVFHLFLLHSHHHVNAYVIYMLIHSKPLKEKYFCLNLARTKNISFEECDKLNSGVAPGSLKTTLLLDRSNMRFCEMECELHFKWSQVLAWIYWCTNLKTYN